MVIFGAVQIVLSQIPDFHRISWISMVASVMSFIYSSIGLGLAVSKVAENGEVKGSLTVFSIGTVTRIQKIWRSFQAVGAVGAIAFAYSYSFIVIEIQDTIKSLPAEHIIMKKSIMISVVLTTIFYMLWGCVGYAAFGDMTPVNLLTGLGFYNPYWVVDIANVAIAIHLLVAYQVYCGPLFTIIENTSARFFPESKFINKNFNIPIPFGRCKLNLFRLAGRTGFVCMTTFLASLVRPFFSDVLGVNWAIGSWPLTVYFPVQMYIVQNKILIWSRRWVFLQIFILASLIISLCVAAGSVAELVIDLKIYKPLKTHY